MDTNSSERSSLRYGPPPNSDEINRLYKDLRRLEKQTTNQGSQHSDNILGAGRQGVSDKTTPDKRSKGSKTSIKSKLKPDIKMSAAFQLISKIEENLLLERMNANTPLHDKNQTTIYKNTKNSTRAYFKQAKRQQSLSEFSSPHKDNSILKSQHINPSTELSRMRDTYEHGNGLIDIDSFLISQDTNKELLLLAKFMSKENKTVIRDRLIKGKELLLKNKILMDKFFARRLHSINQYKKAGLKDVTVLPIKFISYLNKPENENLKEKYLGKIKEERIVDSKNNEMQVTWPIVLYQDLDKIFQMDENQNEINRRSRDEQEQHRVSMAFKKSYVNKNRQKPLKKGIKNSTFEENYEEKKRKFDRMGTLQRKDLPQIKHNLELKASDKEQLTFFYEFTEIDKSGGYQYKRKSNKHWNNLKLDDYDQEVNEKARVEARMYVSTVKIRDKLNPRQKKILMNLVRIIILEDEAPLFERRKSLDLDKIPDPKMIKRNALNKNEKYRDIMKRNLLLANNSTSKRLKELNKLSFKPFGIKNMDEDEAKVFVRNKIFRSNQQMVQKSTQQNILKQYSIQIKKDIAAKQQIENMKLSNKEKQLKKAKKRSKSEMISPHLAHSLPCPLLSESPQVVFQGYVKKKQGSRNRFEEKYALLYGYRIYIYNNMNDAELKKMYFLRDEKITVTQKGIHTFMTFNVNEADFKEKFYLNPHLGYESKMCIEMDHNGQQMKMHLENILAYRQLVKSKAELSRLIDLNSKLVSFYQESARDKLVLEYFGESYKGLHNTGVGSLLFRSFKLHKELKSLEIKNLKMTREATRFVFEVIEMLKFKLKTLKLENCNLDDSALIHFIRFFKSPNFVHMKLLSLKGNNLKDNFVEEILSCLMERIEVQHHKKEFSNPVRKIDLSNNRLTSQVTQIIHKYISALEPHFSNNMTIKDQQCLSLDLSGNLLDDSGFMSLSSSLNKINCVSEIKLGQNYDVTQLGIVRFLAGLSNNCTLQHLDLKGLYIPLKLVHPLQRFLFRNVFLKSVTLSFDKKGLTMFVKEKNYITKYFSYIFIDPELKENYGYKVGESNQEVKNLEKGKKLWQKYRNDIQDAPNTIAVDYGQADEQNNEFVKRRNQGVPNPNTNVFGKLKSNYKRRNGLVPNPKIAIPTADKKLSKSPSGSHKKQ